MTKFTTIFPQAVHFPEWNFITSYVRNLFVFLPRLEKNVLGHFPRIIVGQADYSLIVRQPILNIIYRRSPLYSSQTTGARLSQLVSH